MQLLCSCVEGLSEEKDAVVLRRRLTVLCWVIRACGPAALSLSADIGLGDHLEMLTESVAGGLVKGVQQEYIRAAAGELLLKMR